MEKNRSVFLVVVGGGVGGGGLGARPRRVSINSTIVPLWMFRRSVGVGTPAGGPGREAEELLSCGAAHGAHTIAHRQREGDVSPHHHTQP